MTEAEKLFDEYSRIQNNIRGLQLELDKAEDDRDKEYERALRCSHFTSTIGKTLYDDTGRSGDPVGNIVVQICDLFASRVLNVYIRLEAELAKEKQIQDIIEKAELNSMEMEYVRLRLERGKKAWKAAAQKLNYSESRVFDFRRSALNKIERVLEL